MKSIKLSHLFIPLFSLMVSAILIIVIVKTDNLLTTTLLTTTYYTFFKKQTTIQDQIEEFPYLKLFIDIDTQSIPLKIHPITKNPIIPHSWTTGTKHVLDYQNTSTFHDYTLTMKDNNHNFNALNRIFNKIHILSTESISTEFTSNESKTTSKLNPTLDKYNTQHSNSIAPNLKDTPNFNPSYSKVIAPNTRQIQHLTLETTEDQHNIRFTYLNITNPNNTSLTIVDRRKNKSNTLSLHIHNSHLHNTTIKSTSNLNILIISSKLTNVVVDTPNTQTIRLHQSRVVDTDFKHHNITIKQSLLFNTTANTIEVDNINHIAIHSPITVNDDPILKPITIKDSPNPTTYLYSIETNQSIKLFSLEEYKDMSTRTFDIFRTKPILLPNVRILEFLNIRLSDDEYRDIDNKMTPIYHEELRRATEGFKKALNGESCREVMDGYYDRILSKLQVAILGNSTVEGNDSEDADNVGGF